MSDSVIEKLVDDDFGISSTSVRWARSEQHSSLVVDKERNLVYFNARGLVLDPLNYLMKIRGMPFKEARTYLKALNFEDTYVYTINSTTKEAVVVYPKLVEIFQENGLHERTYWYDRGFTDETIDRFQLGYYDGWYLVPIFVDGTFRTFQKRRDLPKKEIKNWYKGLSGLLYNADLLRLVDTVFIAEGPCDAIALSQLGLPAISQNGGSEYWSDSWFYKFNNVKTIYILYDDDQAGDFGAKMVAKKLGEYKCHIYNFWGMGEKGYDCVDWLKEKRTKEELLGVISEKSKRPFEY